MKLNLIDVDIWNNHKDYLALIVDPCEHKIVFLEKNKISIYLSQIKHKKKMNFIGFIFSKTIFTSISFSLA